MSAEATLPGTGSWRTVSFICGLIVLAALWGGPLVSMSHRAFSPHMLLHLGVILVAAPLLAASVVRYVPAPRSFRDAMGWYLLAAAFEMLAVWSWHIPILHDAAGHQPVLFAIEQASFLGGGMALWTAILSGRRRHEAGAAAIAAFLTFSHMTMFGLVLSLAPVPIYDPSLCQGAFGLNPLADQHLGGALMAAGGLAYLAATAFSTLRALGGR
jgi:putative membrane protein